MAEGKAKNKGHENLIPFSKRSKEEARESGRKGGKKSGQSRALKKTLTESLKELCTPEEINEMNRRLLMMAKHGNLKAYELIRDGLGEKPTDKVEITGNINIADTLKAARERARAAKEKAAGQEPPGGDDG
ncbi:hypothetical protein SAMN04487864_11542 [Succiniclasticum ruminis]|uniref:DUF5681 domain-containing protein n=1 Tax=Succiniclasticum ruminis TaxID=40841 RepID=A0A1G6NRD2_9FIRM|nr:KGG domain-containing protein [Succiniclasticum ruminis]SDC69914.1 hypothetical protein SAMN04487864_11542 [Succiniclasticum ruminis]